jgi:protein TonB
MRTSGHGATKKPELLNRDATARELVRTYPPELRDRGVGDTVLLWLLIDENGRVTHVEVSDPSDWCEFDVAALAVGRVMRFSPAINNGTPVRVWVQVPLIWKTQ